MFSASDKFKIGETKIGEYEWWTADGFKVDEDELLQCDEIKNNILILRNRNEGPTTVEIKKEEIKEERESDKEADCAEATSDITKSKRFYLQIYYTRRYEID